jgi:hypothetical protein
MDGYEESLLQRFESIERAGVCVPYDKDPVAPTLNNSIGEKATCNVSPRTKLHKLYSLRSH